MILAIICAGIVTLGIVGMFSLIFHALGVLGDRADRLTRRVGDLEARLNTEADRG